MPVSSLLFTRFTVGQFLTMLSDPHVNPYGREACWAESPPSVHPIVVIPAAERAVLSARFSQEYLNQAGISLGYRPPDNHPFHWPTVRNLGYS